MRKVAVRTVNSQYLGEGDPSETSAVLETCNMCGWAVFHVHQQEYPGAIIEEHRSSGHGMRRNRENMYSVFWEKYFWSNKKSKLVGFFQSAKATKNMNKI
jgi:hypothetical protein